MARAMLGMFEAMQASVGTGRPALPAEPLLPGGEGKPAPKPSKEALAQKIAAAHSDLEEGKKEWSELLPERFKRAYGQYLSALPNGGDASTDGDCYDWAKAHAEGSPLPALETWQRYVRQARRHYGQQKNSPRAGRSYGRSIVSARDIEPPDAD